MIHDTLFIGLHQALAVISLCCSPLIKLNYRCQRVTMIILELKKNQNPTRWSPVTQWKCVAWSLPAENPPLPCVYLISHYLLCLGRLCALEILEKDKWSLSLITGLSITDALFINPKRQRLTTWEWVSINQSILKGVFTNRNWQIPHSVSLSHRLNKSHLVTKTMNVQGSLFSCTRQFSGHSRADLVHTSLNQLLPSTLVTRKHL